MPCQGGGACLVRVMPTYELLHTSTPLQLYVYMHGRETCQRGPLVEILYVSH